jgi:hypothetical protein
MHVLIFDIWMTVSDRWYQTIIYQFHSNYTSWDWNLAEMHVLIFDIWMTVSDFNTNPTVIILDGIGILTKCMFYLLLSG